MDILWKGIIGGLFTALIVWLSKQGNALPGILALFPTFGLITLYIAGAKGENLALQEACSACLKTLPASFVFWIVCYFAMSSGRLDFRFALLIGLGSWLIVTLLTFHARELL